jgi:hypothetical protein
MTYRRHVISSQKKFKIFVYILLQNESIWNKRFQSSITIVVIGMSFQGYPCNVGQDVLCLFDKRKTLYCHDKTIIHQFFFNLFCIQ